MAHVRLGETIKAYPVGRYAEPRRKGIMHEAHTIYRVEQSPRWNLTRPTGTATIPVTTTPASAASRNELTVEINRQRQATQAVIQGGQAVTDKLSEMTAALQQNRLLAEQNAVMRKELQNTQQRLEALEDEMLSRLPDPPKPITEKDNLPW